MEMTGPQHAAEAEKLLLSSKDALTAVIADAMEGRVEPDVLPAVVQVGHARIAAAQVHATLALVLATVANIRRNGAVSDVAEQWTG